MSARKGKPKQAFLRRAYSTLYYALFHCLANCCSDRLIGKRGRTTSKHAWIEVYRTLDHGFACEQCKNNKVLSKFPADIANFATMFVAMQLKRHNADYDPYARFYKSEVLNDRSTVESAIKAFNACDAKDLRAFASWVLMRRRR